MDIMLNQEESASLAFNSPEWNFTLILPAKSWPVQESWKRNCGSSSLRDSKFHILGKLEAAAWSVGGNITTSLYPLTYLANHRLKLKDRSFPQEHLVLSSCYKNCSPLYFNTNGADGEWHGRICFLWTFVYCFKTSFGYKQKLS